MSGEWTQGRHEAARAACDAATDGPWEAQATTVQKAPFDRDSVLNDIAVMRGHPQWLANAEFIALARTELPAALAEIERLDGRLTRACMEIGELRQQLTVTDEMVEQAAFTWFMENHAPKDRAYAQRAWDALRAEGGLSEDFADARAALEAALGVKA